MRALQRTRQAAMANKNKKRIVLIGPVFPYKGGISHYTGLLSRTLARRYEFRLISWKMQYPKFLFPREQKDYGNDGFKAENAEYLINTANPINIKKVASDIARWRPDLVILEWWHPYFAPCYMLLQHFIPAKILFICHNVFPHERFPLDKCLTRLTLKKGDFFILHAEKEATELCTIIPKPNYRVNVHPTYEAFAHGEMPDRIYNGKTLLFFGFVRPYKGLSVLLKAMQALPDIKLLCVGDFDGKRGKYEEEIEELGIAGRVEITDGYIPDTEVKYWFSQCDAAVLPYTSATQSGIAQIAFGFRKPVIATTVGGLPEVIEDGKTGVLCKPDDPVDLARGIERFYAIRDEVPFAENIETESGRFSWEALADTIHELAFGVE